MIKTIEWTDEGVRMLDQRLLPTEEKYLMLRSYEEVAEAIKKMVVRGAPAIGVSAAMGLALGASQSVGTSVADLEDDFDYMCQVMSATRPTAVNLFWAIERMRSAFSKFKAETKDPQQIFCRRKKISITCVMLPKRAKVAISIRTRRRPCLVKAIRTRGSCSSANNLEIRKISKDIHLLDRQGNC